MTNHHVIKSEIVHANSHVLLDYNTINSGIQLNPVVDGVFYTNKKLDFTVAEFETPSTCRPVNPLAIVNSGKEPFTFEEDARIHIIQHPDGIF